MLVYQSVIWFQFILILDLFPRLQCYLMIVTREISPVDWRFCQHWRATTGRRQLLKICGLADGGCLVSQGNSIANPGIDSIACCAASITWDWNDLLDREE